MGFALEVGAGGIEDGVQHPLDETLEQSAGENRIPRLRIDIGNVAIEQILEARPRLDEKIPAEQILLRHPAGSLGMRYSLIT